MPYVAPTCIEILVDGGEISMAEIDIPDPELLVDESCLYEFKSA